MGKTRSCAVAMDAVLAWTLCLGCLLCLGCQASLTSPALAPAALSVGPASADPEHERDEREEDQREEGQREKLGFGPPPPGYVKILGEAVPSWRAIDQLSERRSPLNWQLLGPRPIVEEFWSGDDDASGRVVGIAPHPADVGTAYIASASGGIWKTVDGGAVWTPLTDELPNLNHGCVALDPASPETVYAGTGEYTTRSSGDGVFRSTDGGAFWERIGTSAQVGPTCSRLIVDPTDPQTIHVTGQSGYVRTTDGGATWTNSLAGERVSDLALDPSDPDVLYAGRHGDGIYRSLDGGDSWNKLTSGLPSSGFGRIVLALAPSQPATVYAAFIDLSNGLLGLYKTFDGGDSWAIKANTPNFPTPQGWYDAFVGVDPTDPDTVYAGGVFPTYAVAGVIKTVNGGDSWTDVTFGAGGSQIHPDMHTVAFGPDGTVWVGCDGGVWKSTDSGGSWINTNATLAVTQNYNIALDPNNPGRVIGGTQDNGTVARDLGTEDWPQILAGDGGFSAFDPTEPLRRYATYVRLTVYRLFGASAVQINGPWGSDPRNFIAPLVMDPNQPNTLLGGTNRVWRTTNAASAATWAAISTSTVGGGGTLNAIAVARGASDTIYTGSSTGRVYVTTDASNWSDRSTGLPVGQISDVFVDPKDPASAYVAFHNTSGARVFFTDDYGVTWSSVTGDLPTGVSARALEVDWRRTPHTLFVGTGVGVYHSTDGGTTWTKDGVDLPNVNIGDLAIDFTANTLTAGTYGRGAWRATLPDLGTLFTDGFESGDTSAWSDVGP